MEGNVCDFSHLNEGVIVPPRKRLLASFKKQNSSGQSCGSSSATPPPTESEAHTFARNLLGSYSSGYSLEEIAESSYKAAFEAAKAAETARTVAEEKAAVAARTIAAAKTALDLVAAFYEQTTGRDSHSKRNKSKKHVAVHSLYKKHDEVENDITDEEQLHQVIFRNHGLSKHTSPSSDPKSPKHKRPKILPVIEKTKVPNGGIMKRDLHAMLNDDATLDTEGSSHEVASLQENRGSRLTKLISSSWRVDNKDVVTQKRKARKQLIRMVERRVELS